MAGDNALSFKLAELLSDKEAAYEFLREYSGLAIADAIRSIRDAHDLTQADLAQMLGTTQSAVARLEDEEYRNYSLSTLTRIAETFNLWPTVKFEQYDVVLSRILSGDLQADQQSSAIEMPYVSNWPVDVYTNETQASSAKSALEPLAAQEQKAAA